MLQRIGSPTVNIISTRKRPVRSFVYIHPLLQGMKFHKHRKTNHTRLPVTFTPVTCFHYLSVFTTVADTPKHTRVHDSTAPVHIRTVPLLPPAQW